MNERDMAAEENYVDGCKDEKIPRLENGNQSLAPISSHLNLNSLLANNIVLKEILDVNELRKVVDLSLQSNNLSELPQNLIKNLANLTKLNLSDNNIQRIDIALKTLVNLRELVMDKNPLDHFPDYIAKLTDLRLISARGSRLTTVPESLANLVNLQELDLGFNKIENLAESLGNLNKLKILNLCNNELRAVPKCLTQGLLGLEMLDLSHNFISEFPTPPRSNNLKIFCFANNPRNGKFPGWLLTQRFSGLEEVVLDDTVFSAFDLPSDLSPTLHVKKFSMVQCGISDTAFEQISQSMIDLEYVNIGNTMRNHDGNIFWVMPAGGLRQPEKLQEFDIQAAGLPALPREVNCLRNLTRLNVSRNSVSSLPEEICELIKLEILNAAHNELYALPHALGNLRALRMLFLETNRLSSLPDSVENLERLECLDLYNNEFLEVPEQLGRIPNLKALDVEGNVFETDNLQIANIDYLKARNSLRSTNILNLRSNDPKVFDQMEDESPNSSLDYEANSFNEENKSSTDLNLSDIGSVENWDSENSADEYDPTVQRRTYRPCSPFTISSFFYYGNFCPADLHSAKIRDQLAAMQGRGQAPLTIEEGQFDDA